MSTLITSVQSSIGIQATQATSGAFSTTFAGNLNRQYANTFSGTTFNNLYFATRIASGAVDAVNLASGLTDNFNNALAYATLRYVMVSNKDVSGHSLTVFGGTLPVISGVITLPASSTLALETNYSIASGFVNLNINPGAANISYDIVALGT